MAFDLSKAKPVEDAPAPKFDLSKAKPVEATEDDNGFVTNPDGTTSAKPGILARVGRGMLDMFQGAKQIEMNAAPTTDKIDPAAANLGLDPIRKGIAPDAAANYTQGVNDEIKQYEKDQGPGFDGARMMGNAAAAAPLAAVTGGGSIPAQIAGGAAAGALTGATQFDPTGGDNRLQNATIGAVAGGASPLLAKAGTALRDGLGKGGSAAQKASKAVADKFGIKLDAAQQTGSRALETLKNTTSNFPFSGAAKAQRTQQNEFNQALGRTMGLDDLPEGQLLPDVMQKHGKKLGAEFEKISNGKAVDVTPKMSETIRKLEAENNTLKTTRDDKISKMLQDAKEDFLPRETGAPSRMMSGQQAQELRSALTTKSREAYAAGDYNLSKAAKELRNAVDDSIYDNLSSAEKQAWDVAKKQYGNYKVVSRALSGSAGETGDVSGVQLWNAVKSDVGRDNMSRASSDLSELASLGKDVLKSKTPDSGTAQRMLYQQMFAPAFGFFAGQTAGEVSGGGPGRHLGGVAGLAAGALTNRTIRSQLVAQLLRNGVLTKNATAAQVADAVRRYGTQAGISAATGEQ